MATKVEKKNTKPSPKPKQRPRVPASVLLASKTDRMVSQTARPASSLTGLPALNTSEVQVEYHKSALTSFRVLLSDVPVRSAEDHPSYDVLWNVPGYSTDPNDVASGITCQLNNTQYQFENLCDYTLFFRLQRPMGYKADLQAIAMWEPIYGGGKPKNTDVVFELPPRTKTHFNVANSSTNLMGPRHCVVEGSEAIHLLSLSLYRDVNNIHGNDPDPEHKGVAFTLAVETHFRVNDGKVGKERGYVVKKFSDASHMDVVVSGPVSAIRVQDLGTDDPLQAMSFYYDDRSTKIRPVGLMTISGQTTYDFNNLDVTSWYRLPISWPMLQYENNIPSDWNVMAWDASLGGWSVGALSSMIIPKTKAGVPSMTKPTLSRRVNPSEIEKLKSWYPSIAANEMLQPCSLVSSRRTVVSKIRNTTGLPLPTLDRGHPTLMQIQDRRSVDVVLDAIIVIVDVIRTVSAFAAALGFLANQDQTLGADGWDACQDLSDQNTKTTPV